MIFVAAHDAGGAQLLAHWLLNTKTLFHAHLEGPACSIFNDLFASYPHRDYRFGLSDYNMILTSTSWQSDHEKIIRSQARADGLRSVAVLDHWVNYKDRFLWQDSLLVPDEIWVHDDDSFVLASHEFPGVLIQKIPNHYHEHIKHLYQCSCRRQTSSKKRKNGAQSTVLYVSEPISEHSAKTHSKAVAANWMYDEFDAFEYFLCQLNKLPVQVSEIIIRPHPSECQDKYVSFYQESPTLIHGSRNKSLTDDFCEADLVVGCESMAMILASQCGIDVYSSIPPNCGPCALPTSKVKMIRDL